MSRVSALAGRFRGGVPRSTPHKLHAARFGRLVGSLGHLVELGDDASEKLGGEWILDRSYVASFVQQTLDRAREVVFDSGVLSGDASLVLHARLDAVRASLDRHLTAAPPVSAESDEGSGEEPEYRLLRTMIERLSLPTTATPPSHEATAAPGLGEVLQEAHERALESFKGLHFRSWGRRAGWTLVESGFPGVVRVVDAGGGLSPPNAPEWRSRVRWSQVDSRPLRALLGSSASSSGRPSVAPESPTAVAVLAEDRSTLAVGWPAGTLVIDARLEEHAPVNFVYCALRGEPPGSTSALAEALADGGFRLHGLGRGLTGWLAGRDEEDTRTALGRVGRSLEKLLRT